MVNSEEEKFLDENDYSSIVGSSLRNVIEKSVTDLVLPYKILSISHLSSWNTFENDLIQILKRNSKLNQDFLLLNHLDIHRNKKQKEDDNDNKYFQCLMNCHINFIPIKSDFDRLRQLMYIA